MLTREVNCRSGIKDAAEETLCAGRLQIFLPFASRATSSERAENDMVRPNCTAALVRAYHADHAAGSIADGLDDSVNFFRAIGIFPLPLL